MNHIVYRTPSFNLTINKTHQLAFFIHKMKKTWSLIPSLLWVFCIAGCTKDAPPEPQKGPPKKATRPARLMEQATLSMVWDRGKQRDSKQPRQLGCQLRLLRRGSQKIIALDLGNAKKRRRYLRQRGYSFTPAIYPATGDSTGSTVAFYTTVDKKSRRMAASKSSKHFLLGKNLGKHWSFYCVLELGPKKALLIAGHLDNGIPRISGSRAIDDLDPDKVRGDLLKRHAGREAIAGRNSAR